MLIGEAPGETEAERGMPFVGRAGQEQERYLNRAGMRSAQFYRTNVVKSYIPGNPDPTPKLVARWTPALEDEIRRVRPDFILAVGRFAAKWLLGDDVDMDSVHGLPQRSGRTSAIVIPTYHPAYGLYDPDARVLISYDYTNAIGIVKGKISAVPVEDEWAGAESYCDVTGRELEREMGLLPSSAPIAIDTEGLLNSDWYWSIQVSESFGRGYVLRATQPDFDAGIAAIRRHALSTARPFVFIHSSMHDFYVTRLMGLDLFDCNLWDTRYAAYITRIEPQALKPLARRTCGMVMDDYREVVGGVALEKQLNFLGRILESTWTKPEPRIVHENDGTSHLYTPQPVDKRAESILVDFYSGKRDKDGDLVDPMARWKKVDRDLRRMVERALGPMPIATLADVDLGKALRYAARDPDATLRVGIRQMQSLDDRALRLVNDGNAVLPVFEEMQASGMLANRAYCERMADVMWSEMCRVQSRISHRYFEGRPFNPNSPDQVATLMRRRVDKDGYQLTGEKRTKTGKMSTSKKSIEHLRYTDEAIADVINWREHQKMRDSFYRPIADRIGEVDKARIHTDLNPYKVTSRRVSSSDPNLTAIPVRNELGVQVRDGFEAEPGCLLGAWDFSQIEMRWMAHLSRDPLLVQFFRDGKDVHAETAARIFGIKVTDVDEMKHRYPAKRAGFGIITSITGHGLLDQLRMFGCVGWDENKCDELISEWLKVYSGVKRFMDDCVDELRHNGVIYDHWGMPRYLPGVWSDDRKVRAEAERTASSHKIQAGAQGLLQQSMIYLKPYIRGLREAGENVRWVLQVHDEILIEGDETLMREVIDPLVRDALINHHGMRLIVPVKCSGNLERTWGQL